MALDNIQQEVWAARLIMELEANSVYQGLANRNWEPDANDAKKVHITSITTDPTVGSYTKDTNITAPQVLDDTDTELLLDQQKYFHLYVDDIDRVQSQPNVMGEYLRKAAIAIAQTKDTYCSTTILNAAVKSGNQKEVTIPASNPNYDTIGKAFLEHVIDIQEEMDEANAPMSAQRFGVITPYWRKVLNRYFLENDDNYQPNVNEATLRMGFMGTLYGFMLLVSNRSPQVESQDTCQFLTSDTWTYADQIMNIEGYRPELRFGDAVKGLYVYGAKVIYDDLLFRIAKAD